MTVERGVRGGVAGGVPAAIAQVRDGADLVVGTGFLVAEDLVVTCAHVLADGGYGPGSMVALVFPHIPGAPAVTGRVLEETWREPHEQDVALVRLERAVVGVAPLRLGSAAGARGHRVRSFGFPVQAPPGGHFGFAAAGGLLPAADSAGELLQLTAANDLTTGFSGGPVLDETTGLVVGMLTAITAPDPHDRGLGIAYATPTAVLREVWPALDEHDVSPYRALEPFAAEHARWFHGREEAVRQVLTGLAGGRRVVLLLGPSGAGKSSLVQAGVLPALAAGRLPGSDCWRPVVVRPGPALPAALTQAGLPGAEAEGTGADTTAGPDIAGGVDAIGGADAAAPETRVVLVVDQFEELLAPSAGPEALQVLARITAAIRSDAALSVVLVMRDDFYSRLSALAPDLLDAALRARGVLNVPATLTAADLEAIVTGPARDLDTHFDPDLAERIIADVLALNPRTAGDAPVTVLPLLEVALTRLWERRLDHDGRLTHDAYRSIGAVTGALTEWCDTALRELDEDQRHIARRILTALVRPADASLNIPAARQQLPLGELRELAAADAAPDTLRAVDEVLAVLARHRIVTTDRLHEGTRPNDPEGTAVAELVHDALIRDWDTLRGWVEQDLRFHDWLHRARLQHARWQEHRDPQDLPSGTLLAEGTDWSERRRLPAGLEDFLRAGRHRQQAAARRSRRLNIVLATALALALIASGIALLQWQATLAAQQTAIAAGIEIAAQQGAQSRLLAAQSASLIATDPDLAALLAVAAYRASPTPEAILALRVGAHLPLRHRLDASGGASSLVFSPDGRTLATGGYDGVRLWDAATGKRTATLTGNTRTVRSVAFSPDGRTLATGGDDATVRLWDPATGKTTATLTGHSGAVRSVAFSPDGRTLATGGEDGSVWLWDVVTGKGAATLTGLSRIGLSVVFSPDGRTLAAGDYDGVRLWDTTTGKALTTLATNVNSVAFSPDGRTLATGDYYGSVRLWDTATGETTATLTGKVQTWDPASGKITVTPGGHTGAVKSVAFSPDGRTLATASGDEAVRLWDTATGKPAASLPAEVEWVAFSPDGRTLATGGHSDSTRLWNAAAIRTVATLNRSNDANSVAFSPDGRTLAAGGADDSVGLWDTTTGETIAILTGHVGAVKSVAFSPDGRTLATGGDDDSARLWDTTTGKTTAILTGHTHTVNSVAFSPDGHTLATASSDEAVRLWGTATGKTTATLTGHVGAVLSVAFSPDGRTLATGGADHIVQLWDTTTGKATATLTTNVNSVAFSPDGRTLATGGDDATVRLWDTTTGKTTATLTDSGFVLSVAFSPDGHTLASGGSNTTTRLWFYTEPDAAISAICAAVARDLTSEEKAAYLPKSSRPVCHS